MEAQPTPTVATNPAVADDSTHDPRAGYDYKFHDLELASEYNCRICLSVSQDPQQAKCCGATFCHYCITRALESSKVGCPNCNQEDIELIPDKAQKQKINKLKVLCPIKDCGWVIELADIEAHKSKPHPLSPPTTTPHSTLQRRQCPEQFATNYSEMSQEQQYTLSPASPPLPPNTDREQSEKSVGQKPPIPTPRKQKLDFGDTGAWTGFISTALSQPTTSTEQPNQSTEEIADYLNVTLSRQRAPRSQSPPQDSQQHYVNLDHLLSPTSPLADQHPQLDQPAQPISQTQPVADQPHQSQSPLAMSDETNFYENISLPPRALDHSCEHSASQPTTSTAAMEVGDYLNITLPRPQVPRNRSRSPPPEPKRHKMSDEDQPSLQPSPLSPPQDQKMNQPAPSDSEMQPLSDTLPQSPNLPNEIAPALPTPALDEFGLPPFVPEATLPQPPTTAEEVPERVNPSLPEPGVSSEGLISLPQLETYHSGELDTVIPELPPDLLTLIPLLDKPPPLQNQMQPLPDQLTDQPSGFVLSPSPPPGLAPPLLTPPPLFSTLLQPLPAQTQQNEPLLATETTACEGVPVLQAEHQPHQQEDDPDCVPMSQPPPDADQIQCVDVQPVLIANQPECVDVSQPQDVPPSNANQPDHSDVPQPSAADQPEYDVSQPREPNQQNYANVPQSSNAQLSEYVAIFQPQVVGQPESLIDLPQPPDVGQPERSEVQGTNQPEYDDMSPPPVIDEVDVSQPSEANQPEYTDVSHPSEADQPEYVAVSQEANEYTTVSQRQLPTPPLEENTSDTLPLSQPPEENYATISVAVQSDTDEHIYEPVPPTNASSVPPPPEEPQQTIYAIPLPPPLPLLPPREPQSPQIEPPPPLPPRSRSPTAEPAAAELEEEQTPLSLPTQNETASSPSSLPAPNQTASSPTSPPPPEQPRTEVENAAQQVLQADQAQLELQRELQQGHADEPDIGEPLGLPPQYDDLSQVPRYNLAQAPAQDTRAAAPSHQQAFVIMNENAPPPQVIEGAIRAENVQIEYAMGGGVQHRDKATKKLRTIL